MMQIIVSVFTAFSLSSGSRLLLQSAPPFVINNPAPQQPAAPAQPQPVIPQTPFVPEPQQPAYIPAQPQVPSGNAPFLPPQPPAAPQQPQQPQINGLPFQPIAPEPVLEVPALHNMDIKCDVAFTEPPSTPGYCAGTALNRRALDFLLPFDGFKFNSGAFGATAYTDITLTARAGSNVQFIEGFWFKEEWCGLEAYIKIVNEQINTAAVASQMPPGYELAQNGGQIEIGKVECMANGSCQGLRLEYDSRTANLNEFICENGCDQCFVLDTNPEQCAMDARGQRACNGVCEPNKDGSGYYVCSTPCVDLA